MLTLLAGWIHASQHSVRPCWRIALKISHTSLIVHFIISISIIFQSVIFQCVIFQSCKFQSSHPSARIYLLDLLLLHQLLVTPEKQRSKSTKIAKKILTSLQVKVFGFVIHTITITITMRYLYSAPYRIGQRR